MHLILLLPWRRWMVWILAPLMHPLATRGTATYRTKNHAGKYVGNRPIKLRKSTWKNRIDFEALEKGKVSSYSHITCSFHIYVSAQLTHVHFANFLQTQPQKKIKPQKRSVLHKWNWKILLVHRLSESHLEKLSEVLTVLLNIRCTTNSHKVPDDTVYNSRRCYVGDWTGVAE